MGGGGGGYLASFTHQLVALKLQLGELWYGG